MFLNCSFLPATQGIDDTRAIAPRSDDAPMTTDGRQQDDNFGKDSRPKTTNDDR